MLDGLFLDGLLIGLNICDANQLTAASTRLQRFGTIDLASHRMIAIGALKMNFAVGWTHFSTPVKEKIRSSIISIECPPTTRADKISTKRTLILFYTRSLGGTRRKSITRQWDLPIHLRPDHSPGTKATADSLATPTQVPINTRWIGLNFRTTPKVG